MDGRIISVREVERENGCRYRRILIKIPVPEMPYQPIEYVPDWRAIQDQQSAFNEGNIKTFGQYEVEMREYNRICDKLDALHIGGVAIIQNQEVVE